MKESRDKRREIVSGRLARKGGWDEDGVELELALSTANEIVESTDERRLSVGEASLELYGLFHATGVNRLRFSLGTDGVVLEASNASLASFGHIRTVLSASACTSNGASGRSNALQPLFQTSAREWVQVLSWDSACLDSYHHLVKLFAGDWSVVHSAALQDLKWLLFSGRATVSLTASLTSSEALNDKLNSMVLVTELRVSALLHKNHQPSHAAVLASLEAATCATQRTGAARGSLRMTAAGFEAPFGGSAASQLWQDLHAESRTNSTMEDMTVTAERRMTNFTPDTPGQFQVHLWLYNPSRTDTVTLQVTEPLHPFYLLLVRSYKLFPSGELVSKQPTFRVLSSQTQASSSVDDMTAPLSSLGSLSWQVRLAPGQRIRASYSAQPQHMHRLMQPSDASRGVELAPVWLRDVESGRVISTSPFRLLLPTSIPDQTMPWNVLTLYSTLLALLLGSFMNAINLNSKKKSNRANVVLTQSQSQSQSQAAKETIDQ